MKERRGKWTQWRIRFIGGVFAVFFIMLGVVRMFNAGFVQYQHAEWSMLVGIVSFVLGILILLGWPSSAFWVLGLFVGIDILLTGLGMAASSICCRGQRA